MIVCADDFGLSSNVDEAIYELCALKRLAAVSCLVALERCTAELCQSLRRYETNVDLGLHLSLTCEGLEQEPSLRPAARNLSTLTCHIIAGRTTDLDLIGGISAQYSLFLKKFGRPPDYIDGHLHVHQLPLVRRGLVEFISTLPTTDRPYVRNTASRTRELVSADLPWTKAGVIGLLGRKMKNLLARAGIPTNSGFFGIYDFAQWKSFPEYLLRFIDCSSNANSILVVHPGHNEPWRRQELKTLREFPALPDLINRFRQG